ncbi:hypothetical protein P7K49_008838 [Saguinus oedipus]|uniref:Uncharacterized protein n=1 Tax=Saguinus oedipus TaxID=9490 RepID=A0ABQ9VYW2_SAGOE|nr:hypothetical protein P7K49_008838 [Saguinus oedipus]
MDWGRYKEDFQKEAAMSQDEVAILADQQKLDMTVDWYNERSSREVLVERLEMSGRNIQDTVPEDLPLRSL